MTADKYGLVGLPFPLKIPSYIGNLYSLASVNDTPSRHILFSNKQVFRELKFRFWFFPQYWTMWLHHSKFLIFCTYMYFLAESTKINLKIGSGSRRRNTAFAYLGPAGDRFPPDHVQNVDSKNKTHKK